MLSTPLLAAVAAVVSVLLSATPVASAVQNQNHSRPCQPSCSSFFDDTRVDVHLVDPARTLRPPTH